MFKDNNPDFYPTPPEVIEKMFEPFFQGVSSGFISHKHEYQENIKKYKFGRNVLEPESGIGTLVKAIENAYTMHSSDIDMLEKDEFMFNSLLGEFGNERNINLVGNDFLEFEPEKDYDAIIMNPPFSEGEKHLLQAIKIGESQMSKCKISCLLNSETLRNPCTKYRQQLARRIRIRNERARKERKKETKKTLASIC